MKKLLLVTSTVALTLVAGLFGTAARAAAPPPDQPGYCTQTYSNAHFTTSLTVPENALCRLYNVQVDGNITVRRGASLIVQSGTSSGVPSLIKGSVSSDHAYVNITNSTVKGSVSINSPQPGGFVVGSGGGQLCNNTLGTTTVQNAPSTGSFSIGGGSCGSYGTTGSAYGNHIVGSLNVNYNQALVTIEGNTIDSSANCSGNNPPPDYENNIVKGSQNGQCQPVTG